MDGEFRQKNAAQFKRAKDALQTLGRTYIVFLADDLVHQTPGFEGPGFKGQKEGTRYIPTGRLRGGWDWRRSPLGSSSKGYNSLRHEAGPFSDYGVETVLRITGQVAGVRVSGISYLENDVAYGNDIVEGTGNHAPIRRNFPMDTFERQETVLKKALAAMRGF